MVLEIVKPRSFLKIALNLSFQLKQLPDRPL